MSAAKCPSGRDHCEHYWYPYGVCCACSANRHVDAMRAGKTREDVDAEFLLTVRTYAPSFSRLAEMLVGQQPNPEAS